MPCKWAIVQSIPSGTSLVCTDKRTCRKYSDKGYKALPVGGQIYPKPSNNALRVEGAQNLPEVSNNALSVCWQNCSMPRTSFAKPRQNTEDARNGNLYWPQPSVYMSDVRKQEEWTEMPDVAAKECPLHLPSFGHAG